MIGSVNVPGASAADLAKVKKIADDAATTANEAKTAAYNAQTAAGEAKTAASAAATAATNAQTKAEQAAQAAADTQEKIESGEIGGSALVGNGVPTAETVGTVGQKYLDTATGAEYTCLAVNENGSCLWGVPSNLDAATLLGDVAGVLESVVGKV